MNAVGFRLPIHSVLLNDNNNMKIGQNNQKWSKPQDDGIKYAVLQTVER